MKKFILLGTILISSLLFAKPNLTPEVKALLKEAKSSVKFVVGSELKVIIKEDSAILLDVRDPDEWEKGGIKAKRVV